MYFILYNINIYYQTSEKNISRLQMFERAKERRGEVVGNLCENGCLINKCN